jgi:hypothetical protein
VDDQRTFDFGESRRKDILVGGVLDECDEQRGCHVQGRRYVDQCLVWGRVHSVLWQVAVGVGPVRSGPPKGYQVADDDGR